MTKNLVNVLTPALDARDLSILVHHSSVLWWGSKFWNSYCKVVQRHYLLGVTTLCAAGLNTSSTFKFKCFDDLFTFQCHLWEGPKLRKEIILLGLSVGGEHFTLLRFTLWWWTIHLAIFCEADYPSSRKWWTIPQINILTYGSEGAFCCKRHSLLFFFLRKWLCQALHCPLYSTFVTIGNYLNPYLLNNIFG